MDDETEAKSRKQEAWATGDYAIIGSRLVLVGELLCEDLDLRSNYKVLDVACGNGNTALSVARRGCEVIGIDFTVPLLEQARERAAAEHLHVEFQEGDAEEIPFPDNSFDVVVSTFGVMFAADQQTAAEELLRVCRHGGKIGLTNWMLTGANLVEDEVIGRYFPPDPDAPPNLWTTEEGIAELLGQEVTEIEARPRTVTYRYPSTEGYVQTVFDKFGPLSKMIETLSENDRDSLRADLIEELERLNRSDDRTLVIPFAYLQVIATKRA